MGPWARPSASLLSQSVNDSELDSAGRYRTAGGNRKGMKQDSEARRTLPTSSAALDSTKEWGRGSREVQGVTGLQGVHRARICGAMTRASEGVGRRANLLILGAEQDENSASTRHAHSLLLDQHTRGGWLARPAQRCVTAGADAARPPRRRRDPRLCGGDSGQLLSRGRAGRIVA